MRIITGLVGGFFLAAFGSIVVTVALALSFAPDTQHMGGMAFLILWVVGFVISLKSPSTRVAICRLCLAMSLFVFVLPIANLLLTGNLFIAQYNPIVEFTTNRSFGLLLTGNMVTNLMGYFGFLVGFFFLIIGLLIGHAPKALILEESK